METFDWVKPGAEVITVYTRAARGLGYGPTSKIDKVYKTGRFTLEGSNKQYTPFATGARESGGTYLSSRIVPLTDEVRADIEMSEKVRAARAFLFEEIDRINRLLRSSATDDAQILREAEYMHMLERYR